MATHVSTSRTALLASSTSHSQSFTVASGTNRVLLIWVSVHIQAGAATVSSVKWGTTDATFVSSSENSTRARIELWRLVAPTETTQNVNVTLSAARTARITTQYYTGVDQTTPLRTPSATSGGNGTSVSESPTSVSGDTVVDGGASDGDRDWTATASQTVRASSGLGSDDLAGSFGEKTATGSTTTMSYTLSSSDQYGFIAAALIDSSGTNATATPSTIAATAAVGSPTVSAGATASPSSVNATAAIPAPTVSTGSNATVNVVTVAAVAAIAAVSIAAGSVVSPGTVSASADIPVPTVTTGSNADVNPSTVSAVANVGSPALSAGAEASPSTVAAVSDVGVPSVTATGEGSFPTPAGRTSNRTDTNTTSHTVNLPTAATIESGDLLLIHGVIDGDTQLTYPTGWAEIVDMLNGTGTASRTVFAYKIASGSEGSSVALTSDASESACWRTWHIKKDKWHGTDVPEATTNPNLNTDTPNPPTHTPSWGSDKSLAIAIMGIDNVDTAVTSFPSFYENTYTDTSANGGGGNTNVTIGGCDRETTSDSVNPGNFVTAASRASSAATVMVRGSSGGTNTTINATSVDAVASIPTSTVNVSVDIPVDTVEAVVSVDSPSIVGSDNATASPTSVAAVASIPSPTIIAVASANVEVETVEAFAAFPALAGITGFLRIWQTVKDDPEGSEWTEVE